MGFANKSGMLHLITGNRDRGATMSRDSDGKGAEAAWSCVSINADPDGTVRMRVLPDRFVALMDRIFAPSGIVLERELELTVKDFDAVFTIKV